MRKALESMKIFAERRARLAQKMQGDVLICCAPPEAGHIGAGYSPFRQDSNLYYLTGFEEPDSVFVFRPGKNPETILFVRKKDLTRETWDGFRFGPEGAQSEFNMQAVYPIDEFDQRIPELMKGSENLYYRLYKNAEMDRKIEEALLGLKASQGRTGYGLLTIRDANELIGELRVIKSFHEIENLRKACALTAEAHLEAMKFVRPGRNEREIQGFAIYQFMKRGAAREGYQTIAASGINACTLHYVFNDQVLKDGDLLLLDAGGEYNYFTADITRTYPINGRFKDAQAEVYQGVLSIQKEIIDMVKPGVALMHLHDVAAQRLTDLMLELGLLTGRKEDLLSANKHRKYYPHGLGHYLGMDVHDAGFYLSKSGEHRKLEEGMVFTIEPGLYIPHNDLDAAEMYRGIGVRIEDNILVTSSGCEILTRDCPKEIADLEKVIGKGAAL